MIETDIVVVTAVRKQPLLSSEVMTLNVMSSLVMNIYISMEFLLQRVKRLISQVS